MPHFTDTVTDLEQLEIGLATTFEGLDQIELIERLLHHYVYTNPQRARELLSRQFGLLNKWEDDLYQLEGKTGRDYFLNYYLNLASLDSQQYQHDRAAGPFEAAIRIAEERGDIADKLEVYLDYTGNLSNLGKMEEASDYFDRCQRLLESYPSDQLLARAYCRHGYLYLLFFSYPKATVKFFEAESLLEGGTFELTPKDHYFYSLVQSGFGSIYQNSSESKLAVAAFVKAIRRCEDIGLRARLPWHQLNLGKELLANGDYLKALEYFQAVLDSEANGSTRALAAAHANMGFCYHNLNQAGRAYRYFDRAESLYRSEKQPDLIELANIDMMRATILMDGEDWEQAIHQLEQALLNAPIGEENNDPRLLGMVADAYLFLAEAHANIEDFESAYHHQRTYDHYNLRYQNQVDIKRQQEFAAQFRAEEREQENEQLKLKASQLQLRALRAQMNPHFLYNALNSIQSFISTNDATTASKYLAKFAMLMRQSLEYTNREYISLEDEKQFLTDYLEINRHLRFEGQLTYEVDLDNELEEDILGIPTMILQPYVENAIEHGLRGQPEGHIEVWFEPSDDNHIIATVTDNGIGRERVREMQAEDEIRQFHQSRGTEITESRLQLLSDNRQQWVVVEDLYHDDGTAAGTRVTVQIPTTDMIPRRSV